MKHITFYFDFISPYAALAFEQLPESLMGLSYGVTYKPILFAALLKRHGQLGPAEIKPNREHLTVTSPKPYFDTCGVVAPMRLMPGVWRPLLPVLRRSVT